MISWLHQINRRNAHRGAALGLFCGATVLLIPMEWYGVGAVAWVLSLALVLTAESSVFRRRMLVLLGCIAILASAPINTDRSTIHFVTLGIPFALVVLGPGLILGRIDPGALDWRFLPRKFAWRDIVYVLVAFPLAWGIIHFYFFVANPELPTHWPMPEACRKNAVWRLFIGINCVGIWDELFFVNIVFALLRTIFPYRVANLAQAVVYTSVLYDMAFTGIGPVVVYLFALTQGFMFEKSRCLLYVLVVHLIVDAFLVAAVLNHYYPGHALHCF